METRRTTLVSLLEERTAATPDRPYMVELSGEQLTYAETVLQAKSWAAAWARLGVGDGDHVVTMQLNSAASVTCWLGLCSLGAIEVPVNIDYRGHLLTHALNLTRARVVGVMARYAPRLADVADELEHLKTVVVLDSDEPIDLPFEVVTRAALFDGVEAASGLRHPEPWDIAVVLFTSGTTGPSKAVRLPWAQLHATVTGMIPTEDLTADEVIYNPGPTYHLGSRVQAFLTALVGARQVIAPFLSMSEMGDVFLRHGVTTGGSIPPSWLAEPEAPGDADRSLRNVLVPIHVRGIDEMKRRFGFRSFGCFSMTEVSVPICDVGWDAAKYDNRGRMSCGRVRDGYPGYEVRVVDENDQPLPPGEVGELVVRTTAPWTMNAGYLNMPEATAEAWRNGWFHTGDAFVYDEGGAFYFIDRLKDCIRRRAENISSAEVESYVNEHPAVMESAAVAIKRRDEPGADEEVKVVVVRVPGQELSAEALIHWLIPHMPRFMIPRYVEFAEELPRTPTMKVRKVELRERAVTADTWDREAAAIELPRL